MGYDHVNVDLDQLSREFGEAVVSAFAPPVMHDNVAALLVSELAKSCEKGVNLASVLCVRRHTEKTDPVYFRRWLRARR
jgi:hypothetical protein